MKIVVLKFGGTSVGTLDRINNVANIIRGYVKKKFKVVVVSSAMSGATNELIKKSKKNKHPSQKKCTFSIYINPYKLYYHPSHI